MNHEQIEGFAAILREVPRLTEIEVRSGEATLRLRRAARTAPVTPRPAAAPVPAENTPPTPLVVTAQHVGVFQALGEQAPVPGSQIKAGQLLGRIDTMRLLSDCTATGAGRLQTVHVEEGQPVEYGQPLFEILPEGL